MVDIENIGRIGQLYGERRNAEAALQQFQEGGRIVSIEVGAKDSPVPHGVRVQTTDMEYPQQMLDQIKSVLQQRLAKIDGELQQLGVTSGQPQAAATKKKG